MLKAVTPVGASISTSGLDPNPAIWQSLLQIELIR